MNRIVVAVAALVVVGALVFAARTGPVTAAERVDRITSELRCPVCQGLSVKDSPSETARAMRDLVIQRVAEGKSDEAIRDEFRASYGDWIVLDPPVLGWTGLVWLAPLALLGAGLLVAWRLARGSPPPAAAPANVDDPAVARLRERARREEAADA